MKNKVIFSLLVGIIFFAFCFTAWADNEETYVWWDEQGQVQYSKTKPDWWKEAVGGPNWTNYETPNVQNQTNAAFDQVISKAKELASTGAQLQDAYISKGQLSRARDIGIEIENIGIKMREQAKTNEQIIKADRLRLQGIEMQLKVERERISKGESH